MTNENDKGKKITEKIGDLPVNSRIYIDYKESPPKITFEYPDTSVNQIRNSSSTVLISMAISLIMILILALIWGYLLNNVLFEAPDTVQVNDAKIVSYNFSGFKEFEGIEINYTWNNKPGFTVIDFSKGGLFWYYPKFEAASDTRRNLLADLIPTITLYVVFFVFLFLNMRWVAKVFAGTNWGHRTFPQINKKLHDRKFSAEFFPEDVDKSKDKCIVELPMFKNMYMDYEATGEFSKYLEKISIIEHPFNRYVRKKENGVRKLINKIRRNMKHSSELDPYYEKKRNIYLWKAIFEFKQPPLKGNLRLWFT